jgi:two-component system KDP operon response regulator KdpE
MSGAELTRILVIDDEAPVRAFLRVTLEAKGFLTFEAKTGQEGLRKIHDDKPDLIILDLGLPDMKGIDVLKSLREWSHLPVLVLTAQDADSEKVQLLDSGADDYLTKPFSMNELLARVRLALRHHAPLEPKPIFRTGNLEVDLNARMVRVSGEVMRLTATEFKVLSVLIHSAGKVVLQRQLLQEVWGSAGLDQPHYLRIYIAQLRRKLEADPSSPKFILTEAGIGYRLDTAD